MDQFDWECHKSHTHILQHYKNKCVLCAIDELTLEGKRLVYAYIEETRKVRDLESKLTEKNG